ncbi:ataxin-7-like protein 2b [Odontesthes bonariensis]|uniref:ataxin-7-like protein 2b n=1 Tax=Odontesthes bonariensis TaxID=219752 RepID=UPI003F584D11
MAALDRRNLNLDDFVGLNWSCLVDRVKILPSDAESCVEDGKYSMHRSETMPLEKEDMHIFGHCPARDDFYLVVCSHCGRVVKPQAFERHCERWHSAITSLFSRSSTLVAEQQRLSPDQPPSNVPSCVEKLEDRCVEGSARSSAVLPRHQYWTNNDLEDTVRVSPWHSGVQLPGEPSLSTSLSESPSLLKLTAVESTEWTCPRRGMRTYNRNKKNINKKQCGLSKHCRVLDPESKKLCSREPTCSVKSIDMNYIVHQQQKAQSKTKTVAQSAAEPRTVSAGPDMEQHLDDVDADVTTLGGKCNFRSDCLILRNQSETLSEEHSNGAVEVEVQPPHPFNQSSLLSEDGEVDEEEDGARDLPATPWHPRPLGLCTFGSHTLGCSIFTFDRRLHHLRFALCAMIERHVSAHLWRKMPKVSSGLGSHHVSPPYIGTSARAVVKPSKSTALLSIESTSLGQLETKSPQQNSPSSTSPYSTPSASRASGRRHKPVRQPRNAKLIEVELLPDANPSLKADELLYSVENKSSGDTGGCPLPQKGPPHIPSCQRPDKSNFSQEKKPDLPPPLRPTEMFDLEKCGAPTHHASRERPAGVQQDMVGSDHRGVAPKRKTPVPRSSSLNKTSKYKCFSSVSRPSLVFWKGENFKDVLS